MYVEFLEALAVYIRSLNRGAEDVVEVPDMTPYLDRVPVLLAGELSGFLVDEIGGQYSYVEATEVEREWWEMRPWKK